MTSKLFGVVNNYRNNFMKLLKYLVVLLILQGINGIFAQELSQEEKQRIIDSLDSNNNRENYNALLLVEHYNITEAIPKLESKAQNGDCTGIYLRLLQELGSGNVQNLAQVSIDSSESCSDPIETRYSCSKILIELGDYSTSQFVIDYYNAKASKFFFDPTLLPKILDNRPDLEPQVKPILFDYSENFLGDPFFRHLANAIISDKYPIEAQPIMANSLRNEPVDATRILSLWLLFEINHPQIQEIMRERIFEEPVASYRFVIVDSLLNEFSTPQNYSFIKNYLITEYDEVTKTLIDTKLETFIPNEPDSSRTVLELLNNLIFFNDTVYSYTWLGDLTFLNELKTFLNTAKTNLQNGDLIACAVKVKSFQDNVDFVYKDSLNADPRFVTIEGWKFLYWNAQYILDRLPEIPIILPPDIEVINPAMSLVNPGAFTMEVNGSGFISSSVVYFNGNARATTFVSDSTLNAQILSTDVSVAGNFPVWVSDNSLNSDTLVYKVVSTLPQPVRPVLECVTNNGNGTYTAYFGYNNKNSVSVYVPIYSQNKISPDPWDRGQPEVFKVGVWERVFSVTWTSGNIIWHLNNKTAKAKTNSPPCQ